MAGPLGRIIAQVVILGVSVLTRALPAAYAAAVQNAKKNGVDKASAAVSKSKISLDEALMIMNLKDSGSKVTADAVQKQYDRYFEANAVEKGGSFYLQSKVYRAKEMLDDYVKEQEEEEKQRASQ
mmetsp:Transcript_29188/g.42829  ORF Transcript_29188/g.42829 Transcript_29188/m.42829 type:complete len:125 (-) Transcript_29188:295-669(-)|eukprot:CAMPEP_0116029094 /NCGR_PEP_ID=MMETSP0321-20121206/15896_1 /TAXON_ID=163516 /ORGANISM="Leptocylindrus danicus var. danicus, Strain B650" /LENGTH=124 /DNA_ID=CAMNT_0003503327 /DNA_START=47 /DNA_END=421 /DNA_ORIENTATION=+